MRVLYRLVVSNSLVQLSALSTQMSGRMSQTLTMQLTVWLHQLMTLNHLAAFSISRVPDQAVVTGVIHLMLTMMCRSVMIERWSIGSEVEAWSWHCSVSSSGYIWRQRWCHDLYRYLAKNILQLMLLVPIAFITNVPVDTDLVMSGQYPTLAPSGG